MGRPRLHDNELRDRLLARSSRVVAERGSGALSLRSLAAAEGTSTTAIYSLFGGKDGLMLALFEEAFRSFGASQFAPKRTGDVVEDLYRLGWAYWDWAIQNPHLYQVMFGGVLRDIDIPPELIEASLTTIAPLSSLVTEGVRAGILTGDPAVITHSVWAAVHGAASLAIMLPSPDRSSASGWDAHRDTAVAPADPRTLFEAALRAQLRGWGA